MVDHEYIDAQSKAGHIAWENRRYGARYAVDTPALVAAAREHVPVVHLGQTEAVAAVRCATPEVQWVVVQLWCPREVAAVRLAARNPADITERLEAWDVTKHLATADLALDTSKIAPREAARAIIRTLDHLAQ